MSASDDASKKEIDGDLEWVLLRQQLNAEREKDEFIPPYKQGFLVKLGLAATVVSFGYGLLHMNNDAKMLKGLGSRITFQLITVMVFSAGYYSYTKSPEYAEKMGKL